MKSIFSFRPEGNPLYTNVNSKLSDRKNKNEYTEILEEMRGYEGAERSNKKGRRRKSQIINEEAEKSRSNSKSRSTSRVSIFGNATKPEDALVFKLKSFADGDIDFEHKEQFQQMQSEVIRKPDNKSHVLRNKVVKPILNIDLRDIKTTNHAIDMNSISLTKQKSSKGTDYHKPYIIPKKSIDINPCHSNVEFKTFGEDMHKIKPSLVPIKKDENCIDSTAQYRSIRAQKVGNSNLVQVDAPPVQLRRPIEFSEVKRSKSINNRLVQSQNQNNIADSNLPNKSLVTVFDDEESRFRRSSQRPSSRKSAQNSPRKRAHSPPLTGIRSLLFDNEKTITQFSIPLVKIPESKSNNLTETLKRNINDITNKFIEFRSYSCKCELHRLDDKSKVIRVFQNFNDSFPHRKKQPRRD